MIGPKALSFYERPDGVTVGVFKSELAALSPDDGQTWSKGGIAFLSLLPRSGDYPGADTKVNASIYLIDDLKTERF